MKAKTYLIVSNNNKAIAAPLYPSLQKSFKSIYSSLSEMRDLGAKFHLINSTVEPTEEKIIKILGGTK